MDTGQCGTAHPVGLRAGAGIACAASLKKRYDLLSGRVSGPGGRRTAQREQSINPDNDAAACEVAVRGAEGRSPARGRGGPGGRAKWRGLPPLERGIVLFRIARLSGAGA